MVSNKHRVGGRPGNQPRPPGGGGYLDICKTFQLIERKHGKKIAKKTKLSMDDLKHIGLDGKWLKIAERIGVEAWIDVWEILDEENINLPSAMRDANRVRVPMFSKLVKYIRNIYIERMTKAGLDARAIYKELRIANIEPLSVHWIRVTQKKIRDRGNNDE